MMAAAVRAVVLVVTLVSTSRQDNAFESFSPEDTQLFEALRGPSLGVSTRMAGSSRTSAASENCSAPNREHGTCKPLSQCPAFLPKLANIRDPEVTAFFKERICRFEVFYVLLCCPDQPTNVLSGPSSPKQDFGSSQSLPGPAPVNRPTQPSPGVPGNGHLSLPGFSQSSGGSSPAANVPSLQRPPQTSFPSSPHRPSISQPDLSSARPQQPPSLQPQQPSFPSLQPPQPSFPSLQPQQPNFPSLQPQAPNPTAGQGPSLGPPRPPSPETQRPRFPSSPIPSSGIPGAQFPVSPQKPTEKVTIPTEEECGFLFAETKNSVGRDETTWRPWLAAVGQKDESDFLATCGGTLVTRRHVLVAAHCMLSPRLPKPTHVRLGHRHSTEAANAPPQDYSIANFVDAGYDSKALRNDVGLITLDRSTPINDLVRPVCLPFIFMYDGFRYQEVDVVGWSRTSTSVGEDDKPLQLDVSRAGVIGVKVCENLYEQEVRGLTMDTQQMCVLAAEDQPCVNDNGAAVTYLDDVTTNRHYLVGVGSFGYGCQRPSAPGAYARVGAFLKWIEENVKE